VYITAWRKQYYVPVNGMFDMWLAPSSASDDTDVMVLSLSSWNVFICSDCPVMWDGRKFSLPRSAVVSGLSALSGKKIRVRISAQLQWFTPNHYLKD
jgi:hypothetical protein